MSIPGSNGTMATATDPPWQTKTAVFLNVEVFAVQFLLGCGGNCLNLLVLLSRKMRSSRTNVLFAAMALADLTFLLVLLPQFFFFIRLLQRFEALFALYIRVNTHLTALANWFSATSIWLMLAVTIERVMVVRRPFQASMRDFSWQFVSLIAMIVTAAFFMTFVHHVTLQTTKTNDGYRQEVNNASYVQPMIVVNAVSVVLLPWLILVVLNIILITALKQHTFPSDAVDGDRTSQQSSSRSRNEKKVTFMVVVIVSSFTLCNAPSAALFIARLFKPGITQSLYFMLLSSTANSLVVTGKVLNFILFCTSSKHFRKLLVERVKKCCPRLYYPEDGRRGRNGGGGGRSQSQSRLSNGGGTALQTCLSAPGRDRHRDSATSSFLEERTPLCQRTASDAGLTTV